jgi:hypothetical protein
VVAIKQQVPRLAERQVPVAVGKEVQPRGPWVQAANPEHDLGAPNVGGRAKEFVDREPAALLRLALSQVHRDQESEAERVAPAVEPTHELGRLAVIFRLAAVQAIERLRED